MQKQDNNDFSNLNKRQETFLNWTLDIFIYTIILNLFAEYSADIYIHTFTLSLFTAVVLKILLSLIIRLEHSITQFFKKFTGRVYKVLNIIIVFSILFFSKFLIIEIINIIFGQYVEIKGFVTLVFMILAMIISRKLIEFIFKKL